MPQPHSVRREAGTFEDEFLDIVAPSSAHRRKIVSLRFGLGCGQPLPLKDVAKRCGVSVARVGLLCQRLGRRAQAAHAPVLDRSLEFVRWQRPMLATEVERSLMRRGLMRANTSIESLAR